MKTNSNKPSVKQKSNVKNTLKQVSSTSFDVDFITSELTKEEKDILKKCVRLISVTKNCHKIVFSVLHDDESKRIIPIDALLKLKAINGKFDVQVSILPLENEIQKTIGTVIYKECNTDIDFSSFLFFSRGFENFGIDLGMYKEITINIFPETVLYNNQGL